MITDKDKRKNEWIPVEKRLPKCTMTPNSFGNEVEVRPPLISPGKTKEHTAFYGCRITDTPSFYKYGAVVTGVTHWRHLPKKKNP